MVRLFDRLSCVGVLIKNVVFGHKKTGKRYNLKLTKPNLTANSCGYIVSNLKR